MDDQLGGKPTEKRVLTGVTTTGLPHLGNYVGAIRPAIAASGNAAQSSFFFLADYHALIKCRDPRQIEFSTRAIAATWLAMGLNTDEAIFYRQSDIPEIVELNWLLTCVAGKGLMNRAHAYKAAVADNLSGEKKDGQSKNVAQDPDFAITMGLYCYPVLMAADILMFNASVVPVGRDQVQHVEMARDIAQRFNHLYGDFFILPKAQIVDETATLKGLDGRKMSKSYNNAIPLFSPRDKLRKLVMKIKTNSLPPGAPKDPVGCTLFEIYQSFAEQSTIETMRARYAEGIAWGEMKEELFELLDSNLGEARQRYEEWMANESALCEILRSGAERARAICEPFMAELRSAVGLGMRFNRARQN